MAVLSKYKRGNHIPYKISFLNFPFLTSFNLEFQLFTNHIAIHIVLNFPFYEIYLIEKGRYQNVIPTKQIGQTIIASS